MARICLHGYVTGKVQGVSFRQYTNEEVQRLDLDGWVRNLPDGRVEILVEGEESAVRELEAWLSSGSPLAEVEAVELQEQSLQGITGFVIRR